MGQKRKPTAHQRQIRFFTIFFAVLLITLMVAALWFLNRTPAWGH
jgi:hypothetical protein